MTFLPVLHRELRGASRQEFTYYLRTIGVAGLLLGLTLFLFKHGEESNFGGRLFANLHLTLFGAIWLVVPFLTADCISQERREGTLGLLFLTRLDSRDLVLAKGLVHGLRALSLWLAVLPVMAVPFVLGGVSWSEAITSAFVNFSAITLALTAGLIASSLSRLWTRVAVWAGIISALFCITFVFTFLLLVSTSVLSPLRAISQLLGNPFFSSMMEAFRVTIDWDGCWPQIMSRFGRYARTWWLGGSAASALLALLVSSVAVRFVAARVRRIWQEEAPSPWVAWFQKKFCQPVFFQRFFRRWMKQRLESNPVGWLEQRSWSGRMVAWGWLGLVAFSYSGMLTDGMMLSLGGPVHQGAHQIMAWLLGASMALSAAGSFRRERESGVLELLLVSPLGEDQIIMGRLRGLWAQFLPAGVLLIAVWCFLTSLFGFSSYYGSGGLDLQSVVYSMVGFLGVPVIGLYFSLSCRSFLTALLATLGIGLLAAPILAGWISLMVGVSPGGGVRSDEIFLHGPVLACQLLLTICCWFGLSTRLKKRSFPLERRAA